MKIQSFKVLVEITAGVEDDAAVMPTTDQVHEALCKLLHEDDYDLVNQLALCITDVGEVRLAETDPELLTSFEKES